MPLVHLEQLSPKVGKADLLKIFDQVGGLPGKRIGKIELSAGRATVEVPSGWEGRVAKALDGTSLAGRTIRAWAGVADAHGTPETHDDHFRRLIELLEIERETEAGRALERGRRLSPADAERTGNALVDLTIVDEEAGLGGRYLLTLAKRQPHSPALDPAGRRQPDRPLAGRAR